MVNVRKSVIVTILTVILSCVAVQALGNSSHLQFYGYAMVDCGYDDPNDGVAKTNYTDEVSSFSNTAHMCGFYPEEDLTKRIELMNAQGVKPLLSVQDIFFEVNGDFMMLRVDYETRWNTFVQTNSLVANASKLLAIYVIDEPGWNGVSYDQIVTATDAVKATLPDVPILLLEAWMALEQFAVPQSVDWVGFVHYEIPYPNIDPAYHQLLEWIKSRRSRADQKIVLLMNGNWFPYYGEAGFPEESMAGVATSYYDLAARDTDVVGIIGYLWPGSFDSPTQKGTRELPLNVLNEHKRIGRFISGK